MGDKLLRHGGIIFFASVISFFFAYVSSFTWQKQLDQRATAYFFFDKFACMPIQMNGSQAMPPFISKLLMRQSTFAK